MDSQRRCSKSFSCESLFSERPSLKRKYRVIETPNASFKNDDYNYLINCNELIKTCKEVLLENAKVITLASEKLTTSTPLFDDETQSEAKDEAQAEYLQEHSIQEFSKWLNYIEQQLDAVCYCLGSASTSISDASNECSSSSSGDGDGETQWDWSVLADEHKAIQSEIESVGRRYINAIRTCGNAVSLSLLGSEERRWHSLWLRSLEYLMIIEECKKCPKHYTTIADTLSSTCCITPPKRHRVSPNGPGLMKDRRIQTVMVGAQGEPFDFRGAKFEIIQKDIGYSSDADMSDACEAHPRTDYINLSSRTGGKRQVKRRRSRTTRRRPWSFHSDWTDWDYYQPPFCYSGEYKSSEDLCSYSDESTVRNLTEFGENYEFWIKSEDDALIRASTPVPPESDVELLTPPKNEGPLLRSGTVGGQGVAAYSTEEQPQSESKAKRKRSPGALYMIYMGLTMFALFLSSILANLPPHVQISYPRRSPPT